MLRPRTQSGFTLVELLVVIAIIGVLASVAMAALNTARTSGANAARNSQADAFIKALEVYYSDNGVYPNNAGWRCLGTTVPCGAIGAGSPTANNAITGLDSYINRPPGESISGTSGSFIGWIYFRQCPSGSRYKGYEIQWVLQGEGRECARNATASYFNGNTKCRYGGGEFADLSC